MKQTDFVATFLKKKDFTTKKNKQTKNKKKRRLITLKTMHTLKYFPFVLLSAAPTLNFEYGE
jgi:hypothetical protein